MSSLQWGAFRDVRNLRDKYWYVGPLREYVAPIFNAFGNKITWQCKTKLIYTPPCSGCSHCRNQPQDIVKSNKRWWSAFIPRFKLGQQSTEIDYSKVINVECSQEHEVEIKPTEIILQTEIESNLSKLTLKIKDEIDSGIDFISQSWHRIRTNENDGKKLLEGRTVTLMPEYNEGDKEKFYYIDNEPFEIRPIQISLIPKAINMYVL